MEDFYLITDKYKILKKIPTRRHPDIYSGVNKSIYSLKSTQKAQNQISKVISKQFRIQSPNLYLKYQSLLSSLIDIHTAFPSVKGCPG